MFKFGGLLILGVCLFIGVCENAYALEACRHIFQSQPRFVPFNNGLESKSIVLDRETRIVTKVYNTKWEFENALASEQALRDILVEAGFKVPKTLSSDSKALTTTKEYIKGITLAEFTKRYLKKNPTLWNHFFKLHQTYFYKAQTALYRKSFLSYSDRSSWGRKGKFNILNGNFYIENRRHELSIHDKNIILKFNTETKEIEFHIIDIR